jgi:hypothetical protein
MEMKQLIMTVLVIVSVCTLCTSQQLIRRLLSFGACVNSEYRNGSAFQLNLNKVLESLVRNVNPSGFNTSSVVVGGKNSNSTVYGFVQCRGDLDSSDCKQCASTAKAKLVQGCHNTSGFIQLDGCFLRYDNRSFYNDIVVRRIHQVNVLCNPGNSSQPQQFTKCCDRPALKYYR